MPAFMSAMGRVSKSAMTRAMAFGDAMVARRNMAYAGLALGAATYVGSRYSNNRFIRDAGNVAGLATLAGGGLMGASRMNWFRGGGATTTASAVTASAATSGINPALQQRFNSWKWNRLRGSAGAVKARTGRGI